MTAPPISNTAEGGTSGTTVTTANSGGVSGNALSAVTIGTNCTFTFDSLHAKGGLSYKFTTPATAAAVRGSWTALGTIVADVWFRFYIYMTVAPGARLTPCNVRTGTAAALSAEIEISTGRQLQFANAAGTVVASLTSVSLIALNQWVRIEWRVRSSTTAGQIEWWLYNTDPEAALGSHTETNSGITLALGANTDEFRFGVATTPAPASYSVWFDDLAISTVGQLGPSGAVGAARRAQPLIATQAVQRALTRCQKLTRRKSGLFVPEEWSERILVPA